MRFLSLLLIGQLVLALARTDGAVEDALISRKHTNATPLVVGPNDASIAQLVVNILERTHYLRKPFNDEVSSKFLERYLDAMDNLHIYFLQSDLAEFEAYRYELDDLAKRGDTTPARVVFARFRERLEQQYDYVMDLLKREPFEFKSDDRYVLIRKELPRPKDLAEARQFWRERLQYEYLQEKLGLPRPETIADLIQKAARQYSPQELRSNIEASRREKARLIEASKVADLSVKPDTAGALPTAKFHLTNVITRLLEGKVSEEKAEDLVDLVESQLGKESPPGLTNAVIAKLNRDNADEIVKIITRRYSRVLRFLNEYDNDDVLQIYLTALAHVYDPHSDYMGKSEFDNFSINMRLSLFGIGALLRSEDGTCRIQSLTPEGPAEKSNKLKANDKIIAVAQSNQPPVDVVDMPLRKVVELIRGPKGTEVRLTIIPADASDSSVRKVISLVRDEIRLEDQAAKAKVHEIPVGKGQTLRLGVIDLPSFYSGFEVDGRKGDGPHKSTTEDVARLLTKLTKENVAGIILDLRRNGGGSLEEAINLTGLFINEGPVVQVKDTTGRKFVENDPNTPYAGEFYKGPMVVLTSRFSASASEILAGALQDYDRALVVGDSTTHGKGTVQSLIQLAPYFRAAGMNPTNNPGAVKITIRKFYRASGESTQLKGVTPNIVLPSIYNDAKIGEDALENPLDGDPIDAASYQKMNRVAQYSEELKKRSQARVNTDKDFAYLQEEIVLAKKARDEKSVSLNEAQRLKEKQEADDRVKARKKELASRPEPPGKVYEVTLKNVDLPGLQPPATKTNALKSASTGPSPETGLRRAPDDAKVSPQPGSDGAAKRPGEMAGSSPAEGKAAAPFKLPAKENSSESSADDHVPLVDMTLDETKRILMDLISLSAKGATIAGTTQEANPRTPGEPPQKVLR